MFSKCSVLRFFSQVNRINKFTPRKIKLVTQELKSKETWRESINPKHPRISLLDNAPTTEIQVIKNVERKNREYPKQHALRMDMEDTNIVSYKKKPLALTEDYFVPKELNIFTPLEFKSPENSRALDVGIIGPTNAGKSTLINILTDANISSVSNKSNTTESIIQGIITDIDSLTQISIFDTPGAFRASKHSLYSNNILTRAWGVLNEVDKAIFMVDSVKRVDRVTKQAIHRFFKLNSDYKSRKIAEKLKSDASMSFEQVVEFSKKIDEELEAAKKTEESLEESKVYRDPTQFTQPIPSILIMNKIDLVTNKRKLKQTQEELESLGKFDKVFHISCTTGFGIDQLKYYLIQEAYRRPWRYHPSHKSTQSEVEKMCQIIKQNVYKRTYKEIPYESFVLLKSWVPLSNGQIKLIFNIEIKNKNQRAILIGKDGINLREIIEQSTKEMCVLLSKPVSIDVNITIRKISNIYKANNISALEY